MKFGKRSLLHTVSQRSRLLHIAIYLSIEAMIFVFLPVYLWGILFKSWANNYTIDKLWRLVIIQRASFFFWALYKMYITIARKGSTYIISLKPQSNSVATYSYYHLIYKGGNQGMETLLAQGHRIPNLGLSNNWTHEVIYHTTLLFNIPMFPNRAKSGLISVCDKLPKGDGTQWNLQIYIWYQILSGTISQDWLREWLVSFCR